ncbi:MAG: TolC family protein [Bacteroidales bacterium]|nr:TolC family protein [Bacteroidales bacterium]
MKKLLSLLILSTSLCLNCNAQGLLLSLDSCINMALRENKQIQIAKLEADIATNTRKAARTKYLPHVTAVGGYMHTGDEISILNLDQKSALSNIGTTTMGAVQAVGTQELTSLFGTIAQMFPESAGKISMIAQGLSEKFGVLTNTLGQTLNQVGNKIVDDFRTDTRDIFGGAIMLNQPLYMGGAIIAGNKMASIAEDIAKIKIQKTEEDLIYSVQTAYYLVVEIEHKKQLADEYAALIKKLNDDVTKMIDEGVATRADGLKVSVRLNEAEMQQLQAEDGLVLAKMLLCKHIGLPLDTEISVNTDIEVRNIDINPNNNRTELQMLGKAVDLLAQKTKVTRASHLPQVLLTGGYLASNPNVFNGFQKKFRGTWNVGVVLKIPIWDWNETGYKVRASKTQTNIAKMELSEAEELIDLQISQTQFKLSEADKKYTVTLKNFETAEENLRCANVGFTEGVMTTTEVMMAQTAWLQAKTQKIEAEIGVITAKLALNHAYGN